MQIDRIHTIFTQNVSPAAHAVFGTAVSYCGTGFYGIAPRDTVSLVSIIKVNEIPKLCCSLNR